MKFTTKKFDKLAVGDVFVRGRDSGEVVIVDSIGPDPEKERLRVECHSPHTGEKLVARFKRVYDVHVIEEDPSHD